MPSFAPRCKGLYGTTFLPFAQIFISFSISLLLILPIYFATSVVSLILRRHSDYGNRPAWLSPSRHYCTMVISALTTLCLAGYIVIPSIGLEVVETKYFPENSYPAIYCCQGGVQPILSLALSPIVIPKTYFTCKFDLETDPRHQPLPASFGKTACLHKCVSTITLVISFCSSSGCSS
ncbi:MAG: hypothetical protein J3R72DRAFT_428038 [Linnemannia gamsii]|nr:MAG: hypothetical protein J3R72DRAFT_428038 [Linnemannia gamsii]